MLIKFKSVRIHNFLSIGNAKIDLDNNHIVLVEGRNNNSSDSAFSNGSGKSSIFNAICWCLTGETIQGVNSDIVNIYGDGRCEVELEFDLNNNSFKVTRQKDASKSDLKIIKSGKDISGKGIRESSKILADEIPDLTSELIGSIIILGQGLPHKFSNNTPAGRKELLEKLSKSDFMVEDIKNRLSSRKDELDNEIRQKQDCIIEEKAKLNIYDNYISDSQSKLEELKGADFSSIKTLTDLIDTNTKTQLQIEEELKSYTSETAKLTGDLAVVTFDRDSQVSQLKEAFDKEVEPLEKEKRDLDREIENVEFKLQHADDDICPTCGQRIPDKEHIDKQPLLDQKAALNEQWNGIADKITEITERFNQKRSEIMFRLDADAVISKLNATGEKKDDAQRRLNEITKVVADYTTQLSALKAEADAYEKNMAQLQQTLDLNIQRKQQAEEKIVYYQEGVEELSLHLDAINQMMTVVKRDFRGYLLTNVIEFIRQKANDYADIIFGSKLITFGLDGNNINIGYNGKPYENLSGGEKQKVDLIVQFAIKDMLSKYLNVYCNILVLDEIFDNLDSIGCEKVLELISTLEDVNSIYIISHHADELQISYDSKIIVEKDNSGISHIV